MLTKTKTSKALARSPRVYTYARFSSDQQKDGSSIARQDAFAERYAKANGLTLDRNLHMEDRGLSGYHGTNVKKGALGAFLDEVEAGTVIPGDTLIVESLDRLSRQEPLDARHYFDRLVRAGIVVVTSNDDKVFSRETVKKDSTLLLWADIVMTRAHEESANKAKNVRGAYRDKCERWTKGERGFLVGAPRAISSKGTIANGTDPEWVLYDREKKKFELVEPAVAAVHRVIALYREGYGSVEIARHVQDEGLHFSESWAVSKVQRIIAQPALIGTKVVVANGERYELENYYPALLSQREYDSLQLLVSRRGIRKGKAEIVPLVTGTKLAYCAFCGSPIVSQNLLSTRADGSQYFKRRLRCAHGYARGVKCEGDVDSCNAEVIERALFDFVGDQGNLDALLAVERGASPEMAKLAQRRAEVVALELKLAKYEKRMQDEDDPLTKTERRVLADTEAAFDKATLEVSHLEREAAIHTHRKPSTSKQWTKLREACLELDSDSRMTVRRMIVETFARIELSLRSVADRSHLALKLIGKGGVERQLILVRRTGELVAVRDLDRADNHVMRIERGPAFKFEIPSYEPAQPAPAAPVAKRATKRAPRARKETVPA